MRAPANTTDPVADVRAFNRFYTNSIGVLTDGLLGTRFSLLEARVLFELGSAASLETAAVRRKLAVDPGYLSRVLSRFERDGLVTRERSGTDARRHVVRLTDHGRAEFDVLNARSSAEVAELLEPLPEEERGRLVDAMHTIESILSPAPSASALELRGVRSGDYGWVIERHGRLYRDEYDWDEHFEGLVAGILANHIETRDEERERGWIAELDGDRVGSIFCMKKSEEIAQLRLLLVEPRARGAGVGSALVAECIGFARRSGYERMMLWTNDVLEDARRIYERSGFVLVEEERHHSFGHDLVGQNWELAL